LATLQPSYSMFNFQISQTGLLLTPPTLQLPLQTRLTSALSAQQPTA